jgi:hypothetical protein
MAANSKKPFGLYEDARGIFPKGALHGTVQPRANTRSVGGFH